MSQTELAQPPYSPVFDPAAGWQGIKDFVSALSFSNYKTLFSDWLYLSSYLRSLTVAAIATAILLVIGLPIAYGMARAPRWLQPMLVTAVILPFWTAFLIRIYAWITILQRDGLLNDVLLALGLIDAPLTWLATDTAIFIGIVYSYLPFMVLPLYAAFEKMDETPARSRRRSRLPALEGVLARDVAAGLAGHRSPAACFASFRWSANSSSPICSAARNRCSSARPCGRSSSPTRTGRSRPRSRPCCLRSCWCRSCSSSASRQRELEER